MKMRVAPYLAMHLVVIFVLMGHVASAENSAEIFVEQDGKRVEMDYVAGFTKTLSTGFFFGGGSGKFVIMASGVRAQMRIKETRPVFYVKVHPSEIGIVKFDTDTLDSKPVRYVLKKGDLWQTGGQAGSPGQANVDFDSKKGGDGFYKITLRETLGRGEYAMIIAKEDVSGSLGGYGAGNKYKIYDFGIE